MSKIIDSIRLQFPQVTNPYPEKPILYFDSAATTLKPICVTNMVNQYYLKECANVHRGIHTLSEVSTGNYEGTRDKLQKFIGAKEREEIIFTKGTTDSINLIAQSYGQTNLKAGDEILITEMEHHSNIVPWQMLCERTGAVLKVAPIDDAGDILVSEFEKLLSNKTKLVSCVYISNALGTINPVKELIKMTRKTDAVFVLDAAQATSHLKVDVKELDCDFMAFSAHKMFGPTGVGVLYGKKALLEAMPPVNGGGDMIDTVTFEKTTYNTLPYKFEAGTPNIAGVIGFGAAIDFINSIGLEEIFEYEHELLEYATEKLLTIPGLKIIGEAQKKAAVISFTIEGLHPHDIATLANKYNVAIRTGHHCTQPLMKRMNVPATARASFSIYNNKAEIDELYESLLKIKTLFG